MPTPEIADDEVLVRVRACGICGSDIHGSDGSTGRRIPPLVMGHEAAGVIERADPRSTASRPAIASRSSRHASCGRYDFCGRHGACDNRTVLGCRCGDYRRHGAFAEYVSVPARILYKLPDSLPFERAALIEAVSIAVHAVSRHVPKPDEAVPVVGSGMIGVLVIQVLREKGCRNIIAVDVDDDKLALAKRVGATRTVNGKDIDVPAAIRELTGGRGPTPHSKSSGTAAR